MNLNGLPYYILCPHITINQKNILIKKILNSRYLAITAKQILITL